MTDQQKPPAGGDLPEPVVRRKRMSASLIWLVPAIAALVGISLVVKTLMQEGPTISITFLSAQGLEPNKTEVKYKDVVIGKVTTIKLAPDRRKVVVKVDLDKSAAGVAVQDTRFWVVRPRIGLGGVSGIDTLLSGSYIGVDVGSSHDQQTDYTGLENPPSVTHDARGKTFTLHTGDLGSLDIGSPVYYRRLQVGRVSSYKLNDDGKGVSVQIFVEQPYDKFVSIDTRFWNASGVDVSLGADGLKLNTQSIATVLAGGVAFLDAPGPHADTTPASENAVFTLFDTQTLAMAPPDGAPHYIRMRFDQTLRGLAVNAPVEFMGINIGSVVSIKMDYDEQTHKFPIYVGAVVYPERLGSAHDKLVKLAKSRGDNDDLSHMMGSLIDHGLRAQAKTGNLLTGQLYISMDFIKNAPKADFNPDARPLEIPTAPGSFDKLQEQIGDIVAKIQKIPFDQIGNNLNQTLISVNKTLGQVNGQVLPQFRDTLKGASQTLHTANDTLSADSPLQQNIGQTLEQLQRMARSLRVLTDYLSAQPSALVRGRAKDADQPDTSTATPQPAAPAQGKQP